VEKLTVQDNRFPAALDRDWCNYLNAFSAYYNLDDQQRARAQAILEKREADTLAYLTTTKELVSKISAYPPDLKLDMTMKQRLDEHERLLNRVRAVEAKFPSIDKDVHSEWKNAKADLAKWRAELKKSLDAQTSKLKMSDESLKKTLTANID